MDLGEEKKILDEMRVNPSAFEYFYDDYYSKIFHYILRRVLSVEAAKDITSEVFLKGYNNIQRFEWRGITLLAWFYRIANHELNRYLKKKSRYRVFSLDALVLDYGFDVADPHLFLDEMKEGEEKLQRHQDFVEVQRRVLLLPLKYQEVISLRFYEKKSLQEIAEILGKKLGTVKSLLSRALDKLRKDATFSGLRGLESEQGIFDQK